MRHLDRKLATCLGWLLTAFVIFSGCSPQWHIEKAGKHTLKALEKGATFTPDTVLVETSDTLVVNSVTIGDTVFTDRIIYKTEFITGEVRYITKKDKRKERKRQRTLDKREFKLDKIEARNQKSYWWIWLIIGLVGGFLGGKFLKVRK